MNTSNELVVLRGGVSVPKSAYLLAITLEARGVHITGDGDDLLVGPRALLTDADRQELRRLKPHLLNLLSYCPPEVM